MGKQARRKIALLSCLNMLLFKHGHGFMKSLPWNNQRQRYPFPQLQPLQFLLSSSMARSSSAKFPRSTVTSLSVAIDQTVALASVSATAKLLSSIGLGGMAAKKPGVLDASAISALSRLTFWVFQPAFLLCSVSKTMFNASRGGLPARFLLLMPLTALLQIALGNLAGLLLTKYQSFDDNEARSLLMCTSFANSGPLPIIFADALFGRNPVLLSEVVACVSFYLLVWSPLFWSYGRVIMGTYGSKSTGNKMQQLLEETKKLLSPPVLGSILGVIVGGFPIFRRLFFSGGLLSPLWGSLHSLGTAYLPAALLVLAGSLIGPGDSNQTAHKNDTSAATDGAINGDQPSPPIVTNPSATVIVSIFISRFVFAPILSFGLLKALEYLGLLGAAGTRARAVVTYAILCEGCMPPNQNSVVMLQLAGFTQRAQTMAKLLTIMYSVAVIPVTLLLTTCLTQSSIMSFL